MIKSQPFDEDMPRIGTLYIYYIVGLGISMRCCLSNSTNVLELFVQLMEERNYDYRIPPILSHSPIYVNISVYINSVGEIDEINMDYSLNIYFRQIWYDRRLEFGDYLPGLDSVAVPDAFVESMWVPDTFIENGKDEKLHTITLPNRGVRVYSDGKVFYSQRLTLRLWCALQLFNFPMDEQTCQLRMMSYRYTVEELKLQWMLNEYLENWQNIELPRFQLVNIATGDCTTGFSTGAYSCIFAEFDFQRQFGYYLIQIYVPSALIVLLSWVSFWLDPLAVPGRISLGVLTILTMSTQMASAASSALPKVSYVKAIDVWLTTCMCFLFAALVEFAVVNSLARREIEFAQNSHIPSDDAPKLEVLVQQIIEHRIANGGGNSSSAQPDRTSGKQCCPGHWIMATKVDILSRVVFPLLFFTFNIVYWIIFTRKKERDSFVT